MIESVAELTESSPDALPEIQRRFGPLPPYFKAMDELVRVEPVEEHMDSESTWNIAKAWTRDCSLGSPEHLRCHEHIQLATSTVASILIDVMSGELCDQIRLTVSPQERESLPYMTLSYHWGHGVDQSKLHLLRTSSIADYRREIPMMHLPRLFRDVVEVARKFNIRYIWIDAYCILQGDTLDWQVEAAHMGEIYQHAILNIAAGGARNTDEPLMKHRNTALVEPSKVLVDWRNLATEMKSTPDDLYLLGTFYVFDNSYIEGQMLDTPLNHRAWVMQEQQLSPRILHFGKHQLFWHCWGDRGRGQACETFPNGTPFNTKVFPRAHQYALQTVVPAELRESLGIDMRLQWHRLIMDYSRCNITKNSDRLIAISGLAHRFGEVLGHDSQDYAAGLWLSDLAFSLSWHGDSLPLTRGPRSHRHTEYVAPSWSWASVSGYIRLLDPVIAQGYTRIGMDISILCDEFQVVMEPVTSNNPFGQVISGRITLSGFIVPGKTLMWVWNLRKHTQRGQALNMAVCFTFPWATYLSCNFDDIRDYEDRKRPWLGLPVFFKADGIDLLPLTYWKHPEVPRQSFFEGLMVVRDTSNNCFRRVGHFRSSDMDFNRTPTNPENLFFLMEGNDNIVLI
jgi:hypothetical protein